MSCTCAHLPTSGFLPLVRSVDYIILADRYTKHRTDWIMASICSHETKLPNISPLKPVIAECGGRGRGMGAFSLWMQSNIGHDIHIIQQFYLYKVFPGDWVAASQQIPSAPADTGDILLFILFSLPCRHQGWLLWTTTGLFSMPEK